MKRLLIAGMLLAAAPIGALAAQNWNNTFATSPAGNSVGNPNAETKLISFVSYSCTHCASFELEADIPLRVQYVHTGKLSVEVRHVIRNPLDLAAALTTECGDKERFFERHRSMMLSHKIWMETAENASSGQQQRWTSGTIASRMKAIAGDLGFYKIMEQRGLERSEINQCLSNEDRAFEILASAQKDNERFSIPGTPSFAVNGELLQGIHGWSGLRAALDADIAAKSGE